MIVPVAFLGELIGHRFEKSDRTLRAEISLPIQDLAAFLGPLGFPPSAIEGPAAAALLPCRRVRHPDSEREALADAALELLEHLIEGGALRLDVRRARRVEALARAVPFQPLHVVRSAE